MSEGAAEVLLFSYGTLQDPAVQQASFGRLLDGAPDRMLGFIKDMVEITDPEVVAESGLTHHPIVRQSAGSQDFVDGMVFHITSQELQAADDYEVDDYKRIRVALASGLKAWVYVAS